MNASEEEVLRVTHRLVALGLEAAKAFNTEQQRLDLEHLLTAERLSTPEGTRLSLQTLQTFRQLTAKHREIYSAFAVSASAELAKAVAELPEVLQEQYRCSWVSSINRHVSAQAAFYENRLKWITLAKELCDLIESRRSDCLFQHDAVVFASEEDTARFNAILDDLDAIHRDEVALFAERLGRTSNGLWALSPPSKT
ncbi:MAG: hypothetical protein KGJ44_01040 [Betaproteobacteria bacterium]|nr:hypothetical protein [Betaproteobacteria bacterium]MDE2046971.1 hypothetical protein [Betaproteobacteria bacterium]